MATAETTPTDIAEADKRTRRAIEQDIRIADAHLRFNPFGEFDHIAVHIVNNDTSQKDRDGPAGYTVMVSKNGFRVVACTCPDVAYHDPDGGCKHMRYVEAALTLAFNILEAEENGNDARAHILREMLDIGREEVDALVTAVKRAKDAE